MVERGGGRAPEELRPVRFEEGVQRDPLGSLLVSMGATKVVCAATLEQSVPPFLKGSGRGWVTAEYGMLPASTTTRTPRDGNRGRTSEIQRLIGRSLRAVTNLQGFGERTIRVDCDVIQADGGTRTAAITGGFMVLVQAFKKMLEMGEIVHLPMKDQLAAVSVGKLGGEMLLDLDYREDSAADVDMNVVMTGSGDFVEIQGTAEEGAFSRQELDALLDLAAKGIRELHRLQLSHMRAVGLV
jgi:ribonuclease PH